MVSISISIWDLIANAMIEMVEHTHKRLVRMSAVDSYFEAIGKVAKQHGVHIHLYEHNRWEVSDPLAEDTFTLQELDDDLVIKLNDGVSSADLRRVFRVRLSLQLMKIFADKQCINALLASAEPCDCHLKTG